MTHTFQTERYADIIDDLKALIPMHWQELALYQDDIPLDPDFSFYMKLDEVGAMKVFSVRKDGELRGYAVYFIRPHPHYKTARWAASDLFWLHPDDRNMGVGNAFFETIEKGLTEAGCHVMHTTHKVDHPAAGFLLEARQHVMVEKGYSKRLG